MSYLSHLELFVVMPRPFPRWQKAPIGAPVLIWINVAVRMFCIGLSVGARYKLRFAYLTLHCVTPVCASLAG